MTLCILLACTSHFAYGSTINRQAGNGQHLSQQENQSEKSNVRNKYCTVCVRNKSSNLVFYSARWKFITEKRKHLTLAPGGLKKFVTRCRRKARSLNVVWYPHPKNPTITRKKDLGSHWVTGEAACQRAKRYNFLNSPHGVVLKRSR